MTHTDHVLHDTPVPVRLRLAALWTSVMFLYVYVDILTLFKPGTVADILDGRVWEFDVSPTWALGAMVLMSIPSVMIALSLLLPARVARWSNIVVGILYVPVSAGNVLGETWSYFYVGAALEVALLLLVTRTAWAWPRGR